MANYSNSRLPDPLLAGYKKFTRTANDAGDPAATAHFGAHGEEKTIFTDFVCVHITSFTVTIWHWNEKAQAWIKGSSQNITVATDALTYDWAMRGRISGFTITNLVTDGDPSAKIDCYMAVSKHLS